MSQGVGERLEAVRSLLGLTQQDFATKLDVAMSTYHRYASGQSASVKNEQLEALADLGVDLTWFVTGRGKPMAGDQGAHRPEGPTAPDPRTLINQAMLQDRRRRNAPADVPEGFVLVPRYDIQASAGGGALIGGEDVLDYMAFQESWVRRALRVDPQRLALISATGDSMEPAIRPGDLLLIDCSVETIMDDSIYLVSLNDFLLVKRVQKLFRGVTVSSDNPNYAPITLDAEEAQELLVRGRVRWVGRLI